MHRRRRGAPGSSLTGSAPAGTLIGVDRDPLAEERFAALAAEVQCETRFIRADFVTCFARAAPGAADRRPRLPGSGHVLHAGGHVGARLLVRV